MKTIRAGLFGVVGILGLSAVLQVIGKAQGIDMRGAASWTLAGAVMCILTATAFYLCARRGTR